MSRRARAATVVGAALLCAPGFGAGAASPPRLEPLLWQEAYPPGRAPARGETLWERVEQAAHALRKARVLLRDSSDRASDGGRAAAGWRGLEERLAAAEKTYREQLSPGLRALAASLDKTRLMAAGLPLGIKERELHARFPPAGAKLPDARDLLHGMREAREHALGEAALAEELLEKALLRLRRAAPATTDAHATAYLHELVGEAEEASLQAAEAAAALAAVQAELAAGEGPYDRAIAGLEAYGGPEGRGPFEEEARARAVLAVNEAIGRLVAHERRCARRVEEARSLDYLLDRLAGL